LVVGAVLEARELSKRYETDGAPVDALRGVDPQVKQGEFLAVMGPSGCGKSTLLHLLGALDWPTSGEVLLDGEPLSSREERDLTLVRRHRIGFVFQFFNLVAVLTARENVALPAVIDGRSPDEHRQRAEELLGLVGLSEVADKVPSQLSGGEQQRVAIARALMNRPAVLLADEPTGNLDYRNGVEVMRLLSSLHDQGETIVLVTHDPTVAAHADRVVFLRDGQVADEMDIGPQSGREELLARLIRLDPD
jgi:putative ABC transport system ATP-binding protein